MTDTAVELVVLGKIILAGFLVFGGIYALYAGQRLFRDGVGLKPGKTDIEIFKQIKVTTTSVGGTLMVTAAVWGWLGSQSLPTYTRTGQELKISNATNTPLGSISIGKSQTQLTDDQKRAIRELARYIEEKYPEGIVRVEGTIALPEDGNKSTTEAISLASDRAALVESELIKSGIKPKHINKTTGFVGSLNAAGNVSIGINSRERRG